MPDPSRIFDLHHSSQQCWILNPLSKAGDPTCILMDISQIRFWWATKGAPVYKLLIHAHPHPKMQTSLTTFLLWATSLEFRLSFIIFSCNCYISQVCLLVCYSCKLIVNWFRSRTILCVCVCECTYTLVAPTIVLWILQNSMSICSDLTYERNDDFGWVSKWIKERVVNLLLILYSPKLPLRSSL